MTVDSKASLAPDPTKGMRAPSDAALVVSARAGEAWAREALFRRHARLANGLAFRLLGRDQDVDDVVQDAYVAALDGLDGLKDPQAFASFLASIVVYTVRRVLRRRRFARKLGLLPRAEIVDTSAIVSKSAPPDAAAELASIYRIVEELPTDERLALILRRVEGLPLDEVAHLCGCSLATAKRRIAGAERRLAAASEEPARTSSPALGERSGT